ncbi:MAG TPA: condensation domain-containing protein, partial [Pyrinomonadaceae bacterium]
MDQPDKCAYRFLLDGDEGDAVTISYAELDRQARAIGGRLQAAGAKDECVLLIYPPGLDYIAAFFGCLYAGAVAVPAYPPQLNRTLSRLQAVAADARAKAVLTTASILLRVERSLDHTPELKKIEWLATDAAGGGTEESWREPLVTSETLAFLQYTSGSTGTPKGVMLSHGNLLHNSALMARGFQYTPLTECVTWLPLYHDMGLIGGVLQPLYGGFPNTLMSPISFVRNPYSWLKAISTFKADLSGGPNFAYDLCARKISDEQRATLDLHNWNVAFTGAEPIRPETLERFAAAFAPCGFRRGAFLPCYGLAEATLIVSCASPGELPLIHAVERDALEQHRVVAASPDAGDGDDVLRLSSCGKPLPGQRVLVVSPESLTECRPDEVGEIWVSGPSVARGYWHREKETEDTFHASLAGTGEGPFLRTGDLGYLSGGELFVTGRLDDLIIIRGRNHYPQDIELTVEKSHAALLPNGGAAFLVQAADEEQQLAVVHELDHRRQAETDAVVAAIRQAVAEDHGVQVSAVLLVRRGGVPKTSSGKIRRKACRAKFLEGSLDAVAEWRETAARLDDAPDLISAPRLNKREAIEAWLTTRLAARRGVNPSAIDVNQPITRYGLDSLAAIELAHGLEKSVGACLPMASFLEGRSVSQLVAQALAQFNEATPLTAVALAPREAVTRHQPSHGQRALWFLHQLAPASPAYNIAVAARILSGVEPATLRLAFQELVNRHPSLRTTFPGVHGEPVQRIHERAEICFCVVDASAWSEATLNERLAEEAHAPFDLENGPVLRVSVFTRAAEEHVLLLAVHHIAADFWSLVVLVKELSALSEAARLGSAAHLPRLNFQYADYARRQAEMLRGGEGERLWSYWKNQLKGKLPLLDLPTDRPRPVLQTYRGSSVTSTLDAELTRRLKALSVERGATLYMTLLAAFQILLHRYTGQDDLLVGSPTAGRNRAELAGVVGYFTNPVVLRADLSQDPSAEDFLAQVRQTVLDAFEHQDYPFALIVEQLQPERDPGRSPIFDAAFVFQKPQEAGNEISAFVLGEAGRNLEVGGLKFETVALEQRAAQFDITLMAAEVGQEIILSLQYNSDLFERATVGRMGEHFQTLLAGIASDPAQRLSQLPLLTAAERQQLLVEWNETGREYPRDKCIHQLFEEQVERTPEAVALVCRDEQVSYRELNERANRLAHYLRSLGVGPEVVVGVCLERSIEMVAAVLGVLKAGGAYLPLDPEYPAERLRFMLE